MSDTRTIPDYLKSVLQVKTWREYTALKRRQLRAVERTMNDFSHGCAFLPRDVYRLTEDLRTKLYDLSRAMRREEIG